jgi:subtilisin-like proprotein convertase family protein/endonuclease/exonuclease/phosphatase family metal-dependent hydrolase
MCGPVSVTGSGRKPCSTSTFFRLAIIANFAVLLGTASAQVRIQEAGVRRDFEISLDEVSVTSSNRFQKFSRINARSLDDIRLLARDRKRDTNEDVALVLYEKDRPRTVFTRRIVTKTILVKLADGTFPPMLNVHHVRAVEFAPGFHLFAAHASLDALEISEQLRNQPGVLYAEPLLARQHRKRFAPNDTLFTDQWHLKNAGQNGGVSGIDVNITNVWDTYRGTNMFIAIVDDGLQTTHTDLVQNVNTVIDYDYNGGDGSPNPDVAADYHGTSCAGVAAGRGNNGRGISGAAPEAKLVGLRLIGGPVTDQDEASAMLHSNTIIQIKSNSWGPDDDGMTLAAPGPLMAAALSSSVTNGRGGRGTIFVWAAGNGDDSNDNANYDGYGNSIYTISIGAVNDQGLKSSYSEPGACVVVSAPSSSFSPDTQGITTTDLMADSGYNYTGAPAELADANYTKTFGGTSSSCPLAAGIIALVLQANTNLGWRDVQEILIRSARRIQTNSAEWITNGAGYHFNHDFGAGLIDARAAVSMALTWTNLGAQSSYAAAQSNIAASITDNSASGVTRTFSLSNLNMRVEHATLQVDITHANRGDLTVLLISPNNTTSVLAELHGDTGNDYDHWTFMSVRNWGESAAGTWTVKVADRRAANAGTLNSLRLEIFGTQIASNSPPILASIGSKSTFTNATLTFSVSATDPEGDMITLIASNKPASAGFSSSGGNGTFAWTNPAPAGVYTVRFYAVASGGTDNESVIITVSNPPAGGTAANIWINEIHYDNASTDINEGFEIAGTAGTALGSYSLILYDGLTGAPYGSNSLSGTIDNEGCGFGAVWFPVSGLQNGAPDGVALIRNGTQVVQRLAYEGSFLASSGPAAGLTASDIGVLEKGTEAAGKALVLRGHGTNYAQFAWSGPTNASPGMLNAGQTISSCAGQPPVLAAIGNKSGSVSNLLQISISATDVDGDTITLSVSNKPASAVFGSTNGTGTFTWSLPNPSGIYTCTFHAVDNDGTDSETILITISAPAGTGSAANVWINEIHYDNTGSDVNEGVEIAGASGASLTNYSLLFYDGNAGTVYKTTALSGSIDNEGCGFGAVWFAASALQNGAPDGVALVRNGTGVVQFLSYEGSFTATAGAANGLTAANVAVLETGTEPVDRSIQLKGTGNAYQQFIWSGSTNPATRGSLNAGQTISGCGGGTTSATPVVRFAATNFFATESAGSVQVPVALSSAAACTVRVAVAGTATSGSDYSLSTNLVFTGSVTQQNLAITISDDAEYETAESIIITITNLSNGTTGSARVAYIDLRDNDAFSIMAANLSIQTDACSSVYRDASARIFRGLKPDIVAVQEFVVTNVGGHSAYVSANFGTNYTHWVEDESDPCGIPNGIISRYPITNSGEWADTEPGAGYRDFVWATIDLPGTRNLHIVSVHLSQSGGPSARENEAEALTNLIAVANFPPDDYVVVAGDLNATNRTDTVLSILSGAVVDTHQPADQNGDKDTNSSRTQDYDYILPEPSLDALHQPLVQNGVTFTNGMVFDSELWATPPSPILTNDSHTAGVQHMAVMKLFGFAPATSEQIWINELHYDNVTVADTNEGVEVAGTSGTSLTNYSIVHYNGTGGGVISTTPLSGTIGDEGCGIGAKWFGISGLQNDIEGFALVRNATSVIQFISYEGSFVATAGAASGLTSTQIGADESSAPVAGLSVQLTGSGNQYNQFTWTGPSTSSTGLLNAGQSITPCSLESPPVLTAIGNKSANVGNSITFSVTASPTDGDTVTLSISNKPASAVFGSTNENGVFSWNPATPAGVYTTRFYAADNDGVVTQSVILHVLNPPPGGIGTLWINELHYNNSGTDTNEGIELAGKAGIVLTNYAIYRYDGQSQKVDSTNFLSGTMKYESCGFGSVWISYADVVGGLENDRSGLALVLRGTQVVHFISYDGSFVASNGPAVGLTSTDIGVNETNPVPPIGQTLQLTGSGTNFMNFTWTGPVAGSTGTLNSGQSISPCAGDGPGPFGLPPQTLAGSPPELTPIGDKFVLRGSDLYFDVHADEFDGDVVVLIASNTPAGSVFDSNQADGQFSWLAAGPEGVYTTTFYAADSDGVVEETVTITVATWIPPPDTLAYYNFDGISGGFTTEPYFAGANVAASGVILTNGTLFGDAAGNPGYAARGSGWHGSNNYFAFTLTAPSGFAFTVTGVRFDDRRSNQGAALWQFNHYDGVTDNMLSSGNTHLQFETNAAAVQSPVFYGTNAFRIRAYQTTLPGSTWKIDNLLISGVMLPENLDSDTDGMADIWEIAHFTDIETVDENDDTDEDRCNDWQEYRAGTNPLDEQSFLGVTEESLATGADVVIRWTSASNRTYVIGRGGQPEGFYTPVATSSATPPLNTYTDSAPTNVTIFYRIELSE